jgi:hypothetical protein
MGVEVEDRRRSVPHPGTRTSARDVSGRIASLASDVRVRTAGFVALAGALIVIAFVSGWQAVRGVQWPYDTDLFRNIANAVTFRDGGVLSDAHYSGVPAWYSPLTSALLGLGSLVTSVPVHRLATQGGVLLNLVTPVVLCVVAARWFGRRTAVLALVAYLFLIGENYPSWAIASYSPWLFVNIYATGLFILALAALPAAVNRGSTKDGLLLGVAAGVVVLAHPASAILLALITAVLFLGACWHAERADLRRLGRSAGIALGTALVVSGPFWLPIMIRYQWRVVNPTAGTYSWPALDVHQVWAFLRDFLWQWPVLVLAVGLPVWFLRRQSQSGGPPRRRSGPLRVGGVSILTAWTVIAFVVFLLEVYRHSPVVGRFPLPDSPSHHYLLALTVALCIWFGIALNAIVQAALGRFDRQWGAIAVVVIVAGITAWTLPSWRDRTDLVGSRAEAEELSAQFDEFEVVDWIRDHTEGDDVFLNVGPGTWNGVLLPGLAGRKSVNLNIAEFSNPFVSYGNRELAQKSMVEALQACDLPRFRQLAREHGRVRYVITQPASTLVSTCPEAVPIVYSDNAVSIQQIATSAR